LKPSATKDDPWWLKLSNARPLSPVAPSHRHSGVTQMDLERSFEHQEHFVLRRMAMPRTFIARELNQLPLLSIQLGDDLGRPGFKNRANCSPRLIALDMVAPRSHVRDIFWVPPEGKMRSTRMFASVWEKIGSSRLPLTR
jgi:hypothetical protein